MLSGTGSDSRTIQSGRWRTIRSSIARMGATLRGLSHRARHHLLVTFIVGLSVAAHYILQYAMPEWIHLSPLAGFLSSLFWIWKD